MESDGEGTNLKEFFNQQHIILKARPRGFHAYLVENALRVLKRKLFYMMRTLKTTKWTDFLQSKSYSSFCFMFC